MTDLMPPPQLCGRMAVSTPKTLRDERATWMIARHAEGNSQRAIAKALGITATSVHQCLHQHGVHHKPKALFSHRLHYSGLRLGGSMTSLFNQLPGDLRDAIADEAAKGDGTICDAIINRLCKG